MTQKSQPVRLTLPWCEADPDAYADAIRDALDADDIDLSEQVGDGRIALALRVFPAHYSACTLVDGVAALYDAMQRITDHAGIARIDCRFGLPSDTPRLQIAISRA